MVTPAYDVFISHANADKAGFVEVLAHRLRSAGVRVWYDDFTVQWGDSISSSIARGLAESRYGIVVLSRAFVQGGWARHELRGLWQREIYEQKTILPILHDITQDEVRSFDAALADLRALDTARNDLEQIVEVALSFLQGERAPARPGSDPLDVESLAGLARLSRAEVMVRLERYGTAARLTPGSGSTVMGKALLYLHLARYGEAMEGFSATTRLLPASSRAHLYLAIAVLGGRKPRTVPLSDIRRVLAALDTAAVLDPGDGLPNLLLAVVKQDYFPTQGLRVPPPAVQEHLRAVVASGIDRAELAAARPLLAVHDSALLDACLR